MPGFAFPSTLPRWAIVALVAVVGALYGLAMALSRIGAAQVPALGYSFGFHFGTAIGLLALMRVQGVALAVTRPMLPYLVVGALLSNVGPSLSLILSAPNLPVGIVAMMATLAPLVTYVVALACRVERFVSRRALGVLLGLVGALLVMVPRTSLPSPDMFPWVLVALGIPLLYGSGAVFNAMKRPAGIDSWTNAAMFHAIGVAVVLPVAMIGGHVPAIDAVPLAAGLALVGNVVCGVATQFLVLEILRLAGPVMMSQVSYVTTMSGLFWGWILFAERHSAWVWAAVLAIIAGVFLVVVPSRRNAGKSGAAAR